MGPTPGTCCWCGAPPRPPLELLRVGGVEALVCRPCRREWRTGRLDTLQNARAWCFRTFLKARGDEALYATARDEIQRRLDKKWRGRDGQQREDFFDGRFGRPSQLRTPSRS